MRDCAPEDGPDDDPDRPNRGEDHKDDQPTKPEQSGTSPTGQPPNVRRLPVASDLTAYDALDLKIMADMINEGCPHSHELE